MYFNIVRNLLIYTLCSLAIFASASILFSCTDQEAIFASIETEEKIETSNLHDNATALGMATMNNNYLIATGGAIFYRGINASVWDQLTLPSGYEGAVSLVEIKPNETAYAVLVKDYYVDISGFGFFKLNTNGSVVGFEEIRTTGADEYIQIMAQQGGEDKVFAMVGSESEWKYYADYQSQSPALLTFSRTYTEDGKETTEEKTTHSATIVGVTQYNYNSTNASPKDYYLAVEGELFKYDSTDNKLIKEEVTFSDIDLKGYIGGIYYSDQNDSLYLSYGSLSESGSYLARGDYDSETNKLIWSRSSKESNSFFTTFIDIKQTSFTGVLVGTRYFRPSIGRDEGYRELNGGAINSRDVPSGNKYTSGKLDTSAVIGFYLYESTLFVRTSNLGVWRGTYNGGKSIDWFRE